MAEKGHKLKKRSDIMRNHSVEFLNILTSSRETLPTLTTRLYQSRLIDNQTKTALLSSPLQQAAIALADCLELKIDQNPKHLAAVLEIFKEEEAMKDLGEKMEMENVNPVPQPAPKPLEGGYDDELFVDGPPIDYQCPVCHLSLRDPYLLSCCGALLCKHCKQRSGDQCPCCRSTDHTAILDKRTRGIILSLKVKCPISECSWTGQLLDLPAHKCPYAVLQCQYGCGEYYFASCISVHEEEYCPKRPYELIVRSFKSQLAVNSSSYERRLMLKDKVIQRLEEENATLVKQLKEEISKKEKELNKKECDLLANTLSYEGKITLKDETIKQLQEKILEKEEEDEKHKLQSAKELLQATEELAHTKTKMMKQEVELRQKIVLLGRTNTAYKFSNNVGELPGWHPGPSTVTRRLIPPCVRAMTNFTKHKLSGDSWYSPPFYTGPGGYKLQLRVDADGSSTARGTHVSVCVHLMKGENDDCLGWPIKGSVTVKLFNWIEDENHLEHPFSTISAVDPQSFSRVTSGVRAPGEMYQRHFIAHKELEFDSEKSTQYMMEDVLCFEMSSIEIFSNYQPSLLPDWAHPELSQLPYGILPVYRTVKNFNQLKKEDAEYYSDPFYTSRGGYKLTLNVYPNGNGPGKGSHVSLFIRLMKGENDQNLPFPFSGIFTIQLLNWKQNAHNIEKTLTFDKTTTRKHTERVTTGKTAGGRGYTQYLSHDGLEKRNDKEYINQDMVCFKIDFCPLPELIPQTGPSVPSWCDVMYTNSSTPPCTRTLYNYTAYKKTNSEWNSLPFYSRDKGYKLELKVVANGDGSGKGTHLSFYVYLLKGEYDDQLQWPFNANITVQLLNWSGDNGHKEKAINHHTAPLECRTRVTEGDRASRGKGYSQFISHSVLESVTSDVQFITDNKICFKIIEITIID